MSRLFNFMMGALLGGMVGSALALLLTPASGESLRSQMRETVVEVQEEVRQAALNRRIELEKQLAALRASQKDLSE
jgi:gas vesicle protein